MSRTKRTLIHCAIALAGGLTMFTCNSEINREGAPVVLVANVTDVLTQLDLADPECGTVVVYELRAFPKRAGTIDDRFLDVIIRTQRTTFVRTDGGTAVPRAFVQNIDMLVPVGGEAAELPSTIVLPREFLNERPFAALQPEAGGRDPETGRTFIRMDVIVEFFGRTLSGEAVATSVRYPMLFCFNCGGCQPEQGAGN